MIGYIYKLIDKRNGKIYIGQHRTKTLPDKYYGSGKIIKRILKKYGTSIFNKEILWIKVNPTQEELNTKEIYYINQYNSTDPTVGYNISIGGSINNWQQHASEIDKLKWREKISKNHIDVSGHRNPMYGKSHNDEAKRKISNNTKKWIKEMTPSQKKQYQQTMSKRTKELWQNDEYRQKVTAWRDDTEKHEKVIAKMLEGNQKWHKKQGHSLTRERPGSPKWYETTSLKDQLIYNIAYQLTKINNKKKQLHGIKTHSQTFWANKSETEKKQIQRARNSGRRRPIKAIDSDNNEYEFTSITELITDLLHITWTRTIHEQVKLAATNNDTYRGYKLSWIKR